MLEQFKNAMVIIFMSILTYFLLVNFILPSSKNYIDYHDNTFISKLYNRSLESSVEIFTDTNGRRAVGSEVYLSESLIVTNSHVIEKAIKNKSKISIVNKQGTFEGTVLKDYPKFDLALLYTDKNKGKPVILADYDKIKIGQAVISIGSSFGHTGTLGVGYITGLNRFLSIEPFMGILTASTGVMPGNSGGGVFNLKGELVGITNAVMAGSDNMGFVIPVNIIKEKFKKYLGK